jgi:hypothetical protein
MRGHTKRIFCHDARGNSDELGVSTIIEKQVVAEILLSARAEITRSAGSGIQCNHSISSAKIDNSFTSLHNRPGQFVSKKRWRHDHSSMVAAAKDLEIGSTREGSAYADNQLTLGSLGNRDLFNANIFAAVKDCGLHGTLGDPARGFDGISTDLNNLFNSVATDMKDFFDGIAADLEDVFNGGTADLDDIFDRNAAAFDGALYRFWHRFLLQRLRVAE